MGHDHDHDHEAEHRRLVMTTVVVGVLLAGHLLLPFWSSAWARPFGVPLALLAAIIGGGRIVFHALEALLAGSVGADIALAIATVAAALAGEYFVAAEVVFIALVGECLEAYAFGRAQRAIKKLLDLRPKTATVLRDGVEFEIKAEDLEVGDLLVVRPGERIAADGSVVSGRTAVDQSALTGEGMPVDKGPGELGLHRHDQPVRPDRGPCREGRRRDDARPGDPPARRRPGEEVPPGAHGRPLRPALPAGGADRGVGRLRRHQCEGPLVAGAIRIARRRGDRRPADPGGPGRGLPLRPDPGDPGRRPGEHGPAGPIGRAGQGRRGDRAPGAGRLPRLRQDRHPDRGAARTGRSPDLRRLESRRPPPPGRRRRAAERAPARPPARGRGRPRRPCIRPRPTTSSPTPAPASRRRSKGRSVLVGNLRLFRERGVAVPRRGRGGHRGARRGRPDGPARRGRRPDRRRPRRPGQGPGRGPRRRPRPEAPRPEGPDDPHRRPPRAGPGRRQEGPPQERRGRADPGGQGRLGPQASSTKGASSP